MNNPVKQVASDVTSTMKDEGKNTVYEAASQVANKDLTPNSQDRPQTTPKPTPFDSDAYQVAVKQDEEQARQRLDVLRKKLRSMMSSDQQTAAVGINQEHQRIVRLQEKQVQGGHTGSAGQSSEGQPKEPFIPQSIKNRKGRETIRNRG